MSMEQLGTPYPSIGAAMGAAMAHNADRAASRSEDDRARRSALYRQHGLCGAPFARTGACTEEPGHPPLGPEGSNWLHAESVGVEEHLLARTVDVPPEPEPAGPAKTARRMCAACDGLRPIDVEGLFRFHDGPPVNHRRTPCRGSRHTPEQVVAMVEAERPRRAADAAPDPAARLSIVAEHLDALRVGRRPRENPTNHALLSSPVLAERARLLLKAIGL